MSRYEFINSRGRLGSYNILQIYMLALGSYNILYLTYFSNNSVSVNAPVVSPPVPAGYDLRGRLLGYGLLQALIVLQHVAVVQIVHGAPGILKIPIFKLQWYAVKKGCVMLVLNTYAGLDTETFCLESEEYLVTQWLGTVWHVHLY